MAPEEMRAIESRWKRIHKELEEMRSGEVAYGEQIVNQAISPVAAN